MTTAAALFLATLCVLCLTSDVALAKKYLDEDGIKRDQKQREVVYPEFDEKLETDIFNALCTTPSSGGGGNETNNSNKWSLPIFCNTYSDNFTDYAQLANPATFKVRLPDDGEENSFEFYPRNKLSKSKLGNDSSDSDPCGKYSVRKNPEFCSLDDLVVIPPGQPVRLEFLPHALLTPGRPSCSPWPLVSSLGPFLPASSLAYWS